MGKGGGAPAAPDPFQTASAEAQFNRVNTYSPGGSGMRFGYTDASGAFQPGLAPKGMQAAQTYVESPTEKAIREKLEPASGALVDRVISDNITGMPDAPRPQDTSALAQQIFDAGYDRMAPGFERENNRLMTNLQARGIPIASKAFDDAYGQQQSSVNDALSQLTMQARGAASDEQTRQFNVDSAARQGSITELVAALGGAYNPPSALPNGQAAGVNYSNLVGQQYQADTAAYNQKLANQTSTMGTIGSLGAAALMKCSVSVKAIAGALSPGWAEAAVRQMPLHVWNYLPGVDHDQSLHVGPMAEDFQRLTGLGDGKTIHIVDVIGLLMGALQAAHKRIERLEAMVLGGARQQ
jgi:hypothetical protein